MQSQLIFNQKESPTPNSDQNCICSDNSQIYDESPSVNQQPTRRTRSLYQYQYQQSHSFDDIKMMTMSPCSVIQPTKRSFYGTPKLRAKAPSQKGQLCPELDPSQLLEIMRGIAHMQSSELSKSGSYDTPLLGAQPQLPTTLILVDCRWDYEYAAGHIATAVSAYSANHLRELLNTEPRDPNTLLVFYCEYSQVRGLKLSNFFHEMDYLLHDGCRWYQDTYLLSGGFNQFYQLYGQTQFVEGEYVTEADERYRQQKLQLNDQGRYLMGIPDKGKYM